MLSVLLLSTLVTVSGRQNIRAEKDFLACQDKNVLESVGKQAQEREALVVATMHPFALSETGECFQFSKGHELDPEIRCFQ